MITTCSETVSLLHALVLGAGEACVSISVPSIVGLLVPFVAIVLMLQWLARRLLFGAPAPKARPQVDAFPRTGQVLATEDSRAEGTSGVLAPRRGDTKAR